MIIKVFGQLRDIIGKDDIVIHEVGDTTALTKKLNEKFPGLSGSKYAVAVNKKVIQNNTVLEQDAEVALLPPFSGG